VPVLRGILCGVHIDFTDFDVRPPSVVFVDPFNETPLNYGACWKFTRFNPRSPLPGGPTGPQQYEVVDMIQAFDTNKPFLCLQGVREYHDSSAHTGDSWFLHRRKNLLIHILTILQQFGSNSAVCQMQIVPTLAPTIQK
jgi:Predicted metal binding domain